MGNRMRLVFYVLSCVSGLLPARPIGILLTNPATNSLKTRFRDKWDDLSVSVEDQEILSLLPVDIEQKATQMAVHELISQLLDTLSNTICISNGENIDAHDDVVMLNQLFDARVVQQRSERGKPVSDAML